MGLDGWMDGCERMDGKDWRDGFLTGHIQGLWMPLDGWVDE